VSSNISLFGAVFEVISEDNFPIDAYLIEVRDGRWEDDVYKIRNEKDEKARRLLKRSLQRVTFSGLFSKREDVGLLEHSGFIAIDLDDLEDVEDVKKLISSDRFVYSAFVSSGGRGLTVLFKINPQKHRDSFLGISEYLLYNYNLITDPQSISVSKPFGVTFDPFIYISEKNVPIFALYPKEKKEQKLASFAFAKNDFEKLIKEITERKINLCEDYSTWLKVGFSLSSKFGENGRDYYHIVSQQSEKYNIIRTDKQYNYCLRGKNLNVATIKTFYYYCKEAGLQIQSEQTAKVRKATLNSKAAGLRKEAIIKNLKEQDGIEDVEELVSEIFDGQANVGDGDSVIEQLELFLSANYSLERNLITRFIELNGVSLQQKDLNSIYISAKKIIGNINYFEFERLIFSDFVKSYNPIHRFLEELPEVIIIRCGEFSSPIIDKLSSTIINDIQPYTEYFVRKWIVSSISSIYGSHSPLMLVLSGEKTGTGKTEWFRRLLPTKLKHYYAESKLDAGKDDEILMTQKWFIMDDEMSGKSKREVQKLKDLTSKQFFSLREPYGKMNVDLMRIATMCATTNSREVVTDTITNRRIIPIPVDDVDKDKYNSIDKTKLFQEAYWLYKNNFDWRVLEQDIKYLNCYVANFEVTVMEKELILRYFSYDNPDEYLSATDIKSELEKLTQQRLTIGMVGRQLTELGYEQKSIRVGNAVAKKWHIKRINRSGFIVQQQETIPTKEKNNGSGFEPLENYEDL
jgi:predicted P-loop ATPase